MAPRPTYLRFYLEPNDDEELVCTFCGRPKCEQSYTVSGGGQKRIVGVHNDCAEKHMDKQAERPKRDTGKVT